MAYFLVHWLMLIFSQSHCDKKEGTDPVGMSPKAKKMKIEGDHEDKTGTLIIELRAIFEKIKQLWFKDLLIKEQLIPYTWV